MVKRDCMHCKHCTLKPMAYENGITNTCDFQSRIDALSMEELKKRIVNKECEWFEAGEPKTSNDLSYND